MADTGGWDARTPRELRAELKYWQAQHAAADDPEDAAFALQFIDACVGAMAERGVKP